MVVWPFLKDLLPAQAHIIKNNQYINYRHHYSDNPFLIISSIY